MNKPCDYLGYEHCRQREQRVRRHFWNNKDVSVAEHRLVEGNVGVEVVVGTRLGEVHRSS